MGRSVARRRFEDQSVGRRRGRPPPERAPGGPPAPGRGPLPKPWPPGRATIGTGSGRSPARSHVGAEAWTRPGDRSGPRDRSLSRGERPRPADRPPGSRTHPGVGRRAGARTQPAAGPTHPVAVRSRPAASPVDPAARSRHRRSGAVAWRGRTVPGARPARSGDAASGQPPDGPVPTPALAVAGVLDGDPARDQLVPQPVRRGRSPGSGAPRALIEQDLELGLEHLGPIRPDPEHRVERLERLKGTPGVGRREGTGVDPSVQLADEVEQGGQGGRDVEVVVERGLEGGPCSVQEIAQRRIVGTVLAVGAQRGERRVEPVDGRGRRREGLVRVGDPHPVVDRDEGVPERAGGDARARARSATRAMLPVDLAIFAPPIWRWAQWSQVRTNVTPVAASLWAISSSWCGKMRSTPPVWMSNDWPRAAMLMAEHSMCQPGRPGPMAVSQDGSPGFGALPQREVADVVLAVLVGLDPLADPQVGRRRAGRDARSAGHEAIRKKIEPSSVR